MILNFSKADRAEIIAVLCSAFRDYPVMRHVLASSADDYDSHLAKLIGFYLDSRLMRDWPVIGIRLHGEGEIVAVAMGNEAVAKPAPDELKRANVRLREVLGEDAFARMDAFETVSDRNEPKYPHYFLGMIGVKPAFQGQGYAAALIEGFRSLSAADGHSQAVVLSTENPSNLPFYKKMGFHIVADAEVGELHTWCLALPTPGTG
ncbi:MAG: GNAT family N-acetyltransferase [Proteobacteria bacterium]|nr:GNAT family N-acetyltransferase [Pseudomonadota bacterium]